jgi:hypothetical protein
MIPCSVLLVISIASSIGNRSRACCMFDGLLLARSVKYDLRVWVVAKIWCKESVVLGPEGYYLKSEIVRAIRLCEQTWRP